MAAGSWMASSAFTRPNRCCREHDLTDGDAYHTIAGFVLWHLGRLPLAGEMLTWRDLRFEVVDMDGQRIDKIIVSSRA